MTALFENRDSHLPFDGDVLREQIEKAAQLEALMAHPGWQILVAEAQQTIEAEQRFVMSGGCKTQDEYASRIGRVTGARAVLQLPVAMVESVRVLQAREAAPTQED